MVLSFLVRAYDRMVIRGEVPRFGFSQEKIGFVISLGADGLPVGLPHDLRRAEGKKRLPASLAVPQPAKRTSGIAPNFLWDKTAYVLGITAAEGKRTAQEHAAFIERHREWLKGTNDPGLIAFLSFLNWWKPERFTELGWPEEMWDQNIVFALESERLSGTYIHDRAAAHALWARLADEGDKTQAICLMTGQEGPVARLHPAIKGVWGAQSSGASIVSFNLDAFTSYGHEQGDNAPVSEVAAFAYTTVLNEFLKRDRGQCLQVSDASVVFCAESKDEQAAEAAKDAFAGFFAVNERAEAKPVGAWMDGLRNGRPVPEWDSLLKPGVRFHILGLAPNAARLSIRFYIHDDFREIAARYAAHQARLHVEPPPSQGTIALWRMARETAVLGKSENVDPHLMGDWLRSILTGAPYPLTLLTTLITRIRADHDINGLRVAMLKSVLIRNFGRKVPVALDPDFKDPGYLLGRLFAVYEQIQTVALGTGVNATIKDKFYGAASSQPRKIFGVLAKNSMNHLAKLRRDKPGRGKYLEGLVLEIMDLIKAKPDSFPAYLSETDQALFPLGYYHQRSALLPKAFSPAKEDAS